MMSPVVRTSPGRALLIGLILAAGVVFTLRGPATVLRLDPVEPTDFRGPYMGTAAWVRGLNPYSPDAFWAMVEAAGLPTGDRVDGFPSRTPYPITTFVAFSPFALFPWRIAHVVAMFVTVGMVLAAVASLSSLGALERRAVHARVARSTDAPDERWARWPLFAAMALALAPLHTGIRVENPTVLAVAMIAIGISRAGRGHVGAAGVMLGLAACLKPPIAAPAIGYYLLVGRWRVVTAASAVVAALAGVGVLRLWISGTPWLADYIFNNTVLVADHGGAIISGMPTQRQFINLQYLGLAVFGSASTANTVAWATGGVLIVSWCALLYARHAPGRELLEVGTILVISLLPFYHRIYDATVLLLPLCWCWASDGGGWRPYRLTAVLLIATFLIPSSTLLEMLVLAGRIPASIVGQWWWRVVVEPHQVWALVALALTLLSAMASPDDVRSAAV